MVKGNRVSTEDFSAMQVGTPYKTYKKVILSLLNINVLNPFNDDEAESIIMSGDPNTDEKALIDIWSEKQDAFFKRMNKQHFEKGYLIEYKRPSVVEISPEVKANTMTDEELDEVLNSRFFVLQNTLNKMTSSAPITRLLAMAEEQEKGEKTVIAIKARLAEVETVDIKAPEKKDVNN